MTYIVKIKGKGIDGIAEEQFTNPDIAERWKRNAEFNGFEVLPIEEVDD